MSWSIGTSTGCCVEQSILDVLPAIHDAGIHGAELGTPPKHFDPWQPMQVTAVHERLTEFGILPVSMHAPFGGLLDLSDPNPHHRRATIGGILTAASVLKQLGGSMIVVHTTDVPRSHGDVQRRLANCVASLSELANACQQIGVTVAVESPLPHLIGGHPDKFEWILRHIDATVGVCLDTAHTTLGHHWDRLLALAADRLVHIHANDHRGQFGDHLPPGDGIIDWRKIVADLRRVEYRGWIILELNCPNGPLAAHLARARMQIEQFLA